MQGSDHLDSQEVYTDSVASNLWKKTSERGALFIDLDDSFYHPTVPGVTQDLYNKSVEQGWPVIVVTGNAFEGVLPRVISNQIPAPHIIVGSVGTEIWVLHDDAALQTAYRKDAAFEQHILSMGYNRYDIAKKVADLITEMSDTESHHNFSFQHPERETSYLHKGEPTPEPFKVSLYYYTNTVEDLESLRSRLLEMFPNHTILISYHTTYNQAHAGEDVKAYCVDILPIGKAGAVNYLTQALNISQGMVVGDSGNDVEMLLETSPALLSLLVGGAKKEAEVALQTGNSIQVEDWRVNLFTMNGQTKICSIDQSQKRVGPESVIAALHMLDTFRNTRTQSL